MKIILSILLLSLSALTYAQDTSPEKIEEPLQETPDIQPQKQEEGSVLNPFQTGPYKNGQYEYYGEEQREAAAKEKEKSQQSQ
ncbi:MAG: hypothetical protein NDI69_01800 [Bacteriovoracaceae bacterium]|nr:hypothetical protein [Bacteriovoracaceae bacterium]